MAEEDIVKKKRKSTHHHMAVFVLTFFSYVFFHMSRKTFSNVKTTISEEWTPSTHNTSSPSLRPDNIWNARTMFNSPYDAEPYLGVLDAAFMVSYAVGLFISGALGDRFNLRYVLSVGLCGTAVTMFAFGCLLEWTHCYNKYIYVILWIINGLLQSSGWPTVVAVMGHWFGKSSRGFIFGLWSANSPVGNILGSLMVISVLDYGYEYAFLFTSCVLFAGGLVVFFGLIPNPKELESPSLILTETYIENIPTNRPVTPDDNAQIEYTIQRNDRPSPGHGINVLKAILLPGVILYSLAYAFLKLVNYSIFFWLPYYLVNDYHWKETVADSISVWYDVGGIVGGTVGGFLSDRFEKRALILVPMLTLAIPSLFGYANSPANLTINAILMSVAGFFINGVANLVSAAVAADLGRQASVNEEAQATVTGIIDGTGSIGAALGQILVPVIQQALGWRAVFYLFMISIFMTGVCMFPVFLRDIRDVCNDGRGCLKCRQPQTTSVDDNTKRTEEENTSLWTISVINIFIFSPVNKYRHQKP